MKIFSLIRKGLSVGVSQSYQVIKQRLVSHIEASIDRKNVQRGKAHTTWDTLKTRFAGAEFKTALDVFKSQSFHFSGDILDFVNTDKEYIINQANKFSENTFDILGSGSIKFDKILWHSDFRLKLEDANADCKFPSKKFYKDIKINTHVGHNLGKDIKVPWELSRFAHLFVLGQAYQLTKYPLYSNTFMQQINNWLESNAYMCGVNWVSPMEVAIRAINWIWAFHFFAPASEIPVEFWQKFVCSLYDHKKFIEKNFEYYDSRTNNHYLSDLLGYQYLCWFFQTAQNSKIKLNWCNLEMQKEFEKQIFAEGTSYEGSTHYHVLVTEIFYHYAFLCKELNLPLNQSFYLKLARMFEFINLCSFEKPKVAAHYCENLISIGDNDSGRILFYGITQLLVDSYSNPESDLTECIYTDFGLSIIKNNDWHISLRHHSYNILQPVGHFHNDVASVTLAYKGLPIIVDPGSYVYTASASWRNKLRSAESHNSFYIENNEPVKLDNNLFYLNLPQNKLSFSLKQKHLEMITAHDLYKNRFLRAKRSVKLDVENNQVIINDIWQPVMGYRPQDFVSVWTLNLYPGLEADCRGMSVFIKYKKKNLLLISSPDLSFTLKESHYSPAYGEIIKSIRIEAKANLQVDKKYSILISGL